MSAQVAGTTVPTRSTNETISSVVRVLAAMKGLSVKQLAEMTGVDEDTLGRRLRGVGKHGWLANEVSAVATALDADVELFFRGLPGEWFKRRQPAVLRRPERHLSLVQAGGQVPAQRHPLVTSH